jgi:hypothetical protein
MPLDFRGPKTINIDYAGVTATLRGLSPEDVARLLSPYGAQLASVVAPFIERKPGDISFENAALSALAMKVMAIVPSLAAEIIAVAADEPDGIEAIKNIPVGAQLMLLSTVVQLTFGPDGGAKAIASFCSELGKSAGDATRLLRNRHH